MKILLIEPNKTPVPADIDGTLKSMQTAVDGYIQAVYPFEESVALVCNEEGKLLGMEPNRLLRHPETVLFTMLSQVPVSYVPLPLTAKTSRV